MKRELNGLKKSVAELRGTVTDLGVTVTNLGVTVTNLGTTVAGLGTSLERTNATVERTNAMLNRTMVFVAQLAGNMTDMKQYLADNMATKADISGLNTRMDGFSGLLLDSRQRWAVHADTLVEHDKRLKHLEGGKV